MFLLFFSVFFFTKTAIFCLQDDKCNTGFERVKMESPSLKSMAWVRNKHLNSGGMLSHSCRKRGRKKALINHWKQTRFGTAKLQVPLHWSALILVQLARSTCSIKFLIGHWIKGLWWMCMGHYVHVRIRKKGCVVGMSFSWMCTLQHQELRDSDKSGRCVWAHFNKCLCVCQNGGC